MNSMANSNRINTLSAANAFEASSSVIGGGGVTGSTTISAASRHNANKKRPISPEQVLRLFGTTTSSSSAPSNYNSNGSGVTRDRGRRSPASSPPSTTHQVNKVSTIFNVVLIITINFPFTRSVHFNFVIIIIVKVMYYIYTRNTYLCEWAYCVNT